MAREAPWLPNVDVWVEVVVLVLLAVCVSELKSPVPPPVLLRVVDVTAVPVTLSPLFCTVVVSDEPLSSKTALSRL